MFCFGLYRTVAINDGIVALSSPDSIAQTGSLYLTGGTLLELIFSSRMASVGRLYFGTTEQDGGIWGAPGSCAEHETPFLSGSGRLQLLAAPRLSLYMITSL